MVNKTNFITCPTCHKPNTWNSSNAFKPFCSERCKLIDLGAWADEQHYIPSNPDDSQEDNDPN